MRKKIRKITAMSMAVAMATMVGPMAVFAAEDPTPAPGTGVTDTLTQDRNDLDVIVPNKAASLTIHKYDITAARNAIEDLDETLKGHEASGEKNSAVEELLKEYALKGVEFTYLKVGDINTSSVKGNVGLMYDIPAALEKAIGLTADTGATDDHKYTSDMLNAQLDTLLKDKVAGKNALEDYMATAGGAKVDTTGADGTITIPGIEQGLYLVVETKVPEEVHTTTNPFFVSVPMTTADGNSWNYDVNVYPKNQTNNPTIDKLVSANGEAFKDVTTASEGDVVDYKVVTKLPTITSKASYLTTYSFVDELSKGISYKKDLKIVFYDTEEDAKTSSNAIATWDGKSENFTVNYETTEAGKGKMTVTMTETGLGLINPNMSDKFMVLEYKADVKSDESVVLGDKGNENDVELTYERTSTGYSSTIKDEAKVYSYGINLKKTFSGTGSATKVKFKLKNVTDNHYITATGENGIYHVTDSAGSESKDGGTTFSPATDGTLKIYGLEADKYSLTEIETDNGYSLLRDPMTIEIKSTVDIITPSRATLTGEKKNPNDTVLVTAGDRAKATVDTQEATMSANGESVNALVDMSVLNTKSFTLPKTGGLGTIVFTMVGAVVVVFGLNGYKKKKTEDEK